MKHLTTSELKVLLAPETSPCVSIYMPTSPGGIEARADKLRLKNAIQDAQTKLELSQFNTTDIKSLLEPATDLLKDATFWSTCSRGLAIWMSPTAQYLYQGPLEFRESVMVSDHFRVRSLLPIWGNEAGYVLAISQEHVRLYRVNRNACEMLQVPDLPANLREALNETSVDRGAQCHSAGKNLRKKQSAVFHAQGAGHDSEKQDLREYCRHVDKVVTSYLPPTDAPLALACVGSLAPIYREVSSYAHLLAEFIEGSPDHLTNQRIVELAWPLLSAYWSGDLARQLTRLKDSSRSDWTTADTCQIVLAACQGHVEVLFFDDDRDQWGCCERDEEIVDVHDVAAPNDEELIELAVSETLRHRGTVYPVRSELLPSPLPMAAILRHVPARLISSLSCVARPESSKGVVSQ